MDVPVLNFPYAEVAQAVTDADLAGQSVTAVQVDSTTGEITILTDSTDIKVDTTNDTSAFYNDLVTSTSSPVDTSSP